jgi:hypothetical protein
MDRAQLEKLALEKISKTQAVPSSTIDRDQLEQLALEKLSSSGMTEVDPGTEASIGVINRAQYAIEPLQSNRKAFLEREFGADNVMEDKNGELYLNQDGKFLPLNRKAQYFGDISTGDIADVAGALPETMGSVAGTVAGAVGGGGALSVPGALAVGAAGGAAGSAARQALSGIIGTPQVASLAERGSETAFSGAAGAAGAGAGLLLKAAKPGITQIIKNLTGKGSEVTETALKNTSTTTADSTFNAAGELVPQYEKQTAEAIAGEIADQSGRGAVQAEKKALEEISKRQGIPSPTYAQGAQGKALIAEAKIMDTPLIGGKVRKHVDSQLKTIKNNIEKITGKAIDAKSSSQEVGIATRDYAETALEAQKKIAQELYSHVEEVGKNASIGAQSLYRQFQKGASKLGLINPDQTRARYSADLGLTREEFNHLQNAFFDR